MATVSPSQLQFNDAQRFFTNCLTGGNAPESLTQQYLNVIKVALLSFVGGGAAPKVAIEFGRRVVPSSAKPSFLEMEESLRQKK